MTLRNTVGSAPRTIIPSRQTSDDSCSACHHAILAAKLPGLLADYQVSRRTTTVSRAVPAIPQLR